MVVVEAAEAVDVQGDAGALGERLQAVGNHLAAEVADLLTLKAELDDTEGAVGQIDDGAGECLVERGVGVAETGEASHGAESFGKGVSEGDADVFGGVVIVDWRDLVSGPVVVTRGTGRGDIL